MALSSPIPHCSSNLMSLPNELLLVVADHLPHQRDIYRFMRVNRRTSTVLIGTLFRHNIREHESSALAWAVRHDYVRVVHRLLRLHANVDTMQGGKCIPPIYVAVGKGNLRMVKILLAAGAQIEIELGPFKMSLLVLAIRDHNEPIARVLIGRTKDLDAPVEGPKRPLALACAERLVETVQFLLDKGSTPELPSENQSDGLDSLLALKDEHEQRLDDKCIEILRLLLFHGLILSKTQLELGETHKDPRVRYLFFVVTTSLQALRASSEAVHPEPDSTETRYATEFPPLQAHDGLVNVREDGPWVPWAVKNTQRLRASLTFREENSGSEYSSTAEFDPHPQLGLDLQEKNEEAQKLWNGFRQIKQHRPQEAESSVTKKLTTTKSVQQATETVEFPPLSNNIQHTNKEGFDVWSNFKWQTTPPAPNRIGSAPVAATTTIEGRKVKESERKRKGKWKKLQIY